MAKIYIVTSGDYSDYRIDEVFSTKEKAEEYVQQHGTDYRIEDYDIDKEVKKETKIWCVKMRFDNFEVSECFGGGSLSLRKDTFEYFFDDWAMIGYIILYFEADCMDMAIKIANERAAQIKANKDMLYAKAFEGVKEPFCKYSKSYPIVRYKTGEIMKRP